MMEKKKKSIKDEFNLMAVLLIPIAVGINIVGGQLAGALKIPIYLDCIGTILIAMLAGPWVGALTGLLSNVANALISGPEWLPYALVSIAIGLMAGVLSKKGMFLNIVKTVISGFILAFTASIIAAPITVYLFGGVTSSGSTFITAFLLATGKNIFESVFTSSIIADSADKLISVFVSYSIIKNMSARYLSKFSYGSQYIKKGNKETNI